MEFGATNLGMKHHNSLLNSLESLADLRERVRNRFMPCKDVSEEDLARPKPCRAAFGMQSAPSEALTKPLRRLRGTTSLPVEGDAGLEILDILYSKVNSGDGSPNAYFHGSPPCRASNPMVHDVYFTQKRGVAPPVIISQKSCSSSAHGGNSAAKSNSSAKGSYCNTTCGSKPFVRIEGFASAQSDANRGVPAYA